MDNAAVKVHMNFRVSNTHGIGKVRHFTIIYCAWPSELKRSQAELAQYIRKHLPTEWSLKEWRRNSCARDAVGNRIWVPPELRTWKVVEPTVKQPV